MHIVIAGISALVGLIWALVALQRSGFRLDSLDPFAWYRRTRWKNRLGVNPLYNLDTPVEAAAVLLLGVAKCEGEVSAEQKRELTSIFENDLHQTPDQAAELLVSSTYLSRNEFYLVDNLQKILAKSADGFAEVHVQSLLSLMCRVSTLEGPANLEQQKLIGETERYFTAKASRKPAW
jgi:hypothetical protein